MAKIKGKIWSSGCRRISISVPENVRKKVEEIWKKEQEKKHPQPVSKSSIYVKLLLLGIEKYEKL